MVGRKTLVLCLALTVVGCRRGVADEIEIGAKAPDFSAVGVDDQSYNLASAKDAKVVVLCFTCNKCPVAVAYQDRLVEFAEKYQDKGVKLIALNCNNRTEGLDVMKERAEKAGFNFPYVFDESGDAARAYGARVTPHVFVLDSDRNVAYRGAIDDSQKSPETHYLVDAVEALLDGKTPETDSTKARGCGIKLKDTEKKKKKKKG